MSADEVEARRRARANWQVRIEPLGREIEATMRDTVAERLAATWELSLQAWSVAGKAMPAVARAALPVRIVARSEAE